MINLLFILVVVFAIPMSAFSNSFDGVPDIYEQVGFDEKDFGVAYPNKDLTPGRIVPDITKERVCASGYARHMRNKLSDKTKLEVYRRYGIKKDSKKFNIDHFIPLSLGGTNDIENLWVEPILKNAGWREKQYVETYLHRKVCSGEMSLQDAQERIQDDWHKIYREMRGMK